jgi:hypothetical protein
MGKGWPVGKGAPITIGAGVIKQKRLTAKNAKKCREGRKENQGPYQISTVSAEQTV